MSGTFFSRRRPWGGLKCVTVVKLTFSKHVFINCASFFIFVSWPPTLLICVSLSHRLLTFGFGGRFPGAPAGRLGRRKHQFYLRNLKVFFEIINFIKGIWYFSALVGLWGASGALAPPLETFSGFLWSHLWSWNLSGVLFGCICVLFGLLLLLFDIPWDHIF